MADNSSLTDLRILANYAAQTKQEIFGAEERLKRLKENLRRTLEESIPLLMQELGMTKFVTTDGIVFEIKQEFTAKISEANYKSALEWLDTNGFGDIVRTEMVVPTIRGDRRNIAEVTAMLESFGFTPELKEGVHHSTLKAFIKERIKAGDNIPFDIFGIHPYWQTKVSEQS
jgi:hypothetical protein